MSTSSRWWVLVACIAPFALLTVALRPSAVRSSGDGAAESASVPVSIDQWHGRDVPVSQRTLEVLGADRVLNREYRSAAGEQVHLCIVESRSRRTSIHPPEVCYRGWGYEAETSTTTTVAAPDGDFRANLLTMVKPERRVAVLYWYRSGERRTTSFLGQQMRLVLRRPFAGGEAAVAALVRISTEITETGPGAEEAALSRLRRFAAGLAASGG